VIKNLSFCKNLSVDETTTNNIYIEGDNLEVLNYLEKEYKNKIRMIYIDPPYNTGNSFIYKDSYKNWADMIAPRLKSAKNLMCDDGVIFISIGEEEVENLKHICNNIFGKENFITKFIYEKTQHFGRQKLNTYSNAEYILCYAKCLFDKKIKELLVERISKNLMDAPLYNASNNMKEITFPSGSVTFNIKDGTYNKTESAQYELLNNVKVINNRNENDFTLRFRSRWSQKNVIDELNMGTRFLIKTKKFAVRAIYKQERCTKIAPKQILFTNPQNPTISRFGEKISSSEAATGELEKLLGGKYFNYPKSVSLLSYLISLIFDYKTQTFPNDFIILDFFSGSGTTAHACMHLNSIDNGKRKFILIQKPETIPNKSPAKTAGYNNIFELGRKRIILTGQNIKKQNSKTDIGFKVYKTINR